MPRKRTKYGLGSISSPSISGHPPWLWASCSAPIRPHPSLSGNDSGRIRCPRCVSPRPWWSSAAVDQAEVSEQSDGGDPASREGVTVDSPVWQLAIAFLPPLLTALLTGSGFWLAERLKDRDAAQQRLKAISEESARVQFLRSWLKTYSMVPGTEEEGAGGARAGVGRDLVASHNRLTQALEKHSGVDGPSVASRAWRRAFLIPQARPAARMVRWAYWLFMTLGVFLTLAFMTSGYGTTDGAQPAPLTVFASGLILFVPFFVIAMIFHAWSSRLERRFHQGRTV